MTGTVPMKSDASCQIKRRPSERQTDDFERRRYESTFDSSNYGFSRSSLSEKWVEWSKRSNSTGRAGLCKELMSIRNKNGTIKMFPVYGHSQFMQQYARAPTYSYFRDTYRYSRRRAAMPGLSTYGRPQCGYTNPKLNALSNSNH